MPKSFNRSFVAVLAAAMLLLAGGVSFGQTSDSSTSQQSSSGGDQPSGPAFGLGINLGVQTFANPSYDPSQPVSATNEPTIAYQSLGLKPDFSIGKLGVGLDLTLNYRFTGGPNGDQFAIRSEDWIPDQNTSFLELYLPKIRYLSWAQKGDPLYVKLGSIDDTTLGNGFIVGDYANTQFLPDRRIFGLNFDLDGQLFKFPYVGVETFVDNLAAFDLLGGRLYTRPIYFTHIPIISNLQVGGTFVIDRNPFYYALRDPNSDFNANTGSLTPPSNASVQIWGADVRQPILSNSVLSLAAFGDYVRENQANGGMIGFGGRLFGAVTYGAQLRLLGQNFIPTYFDSTYDLYRVDKYAVYSGTDPRTGNPVTLPAYNGWFFTSGFSLLSDKLVFNVSLDGPFNPDYSDPIASKFAYPHLRAVFVLAQGIIPGVAISATYDKTNIDSLSALISPANAVIGAQIDYKTGPAVISLVYNLTYDPFTTSGGNPWKITSRLESSISLF